MNLRVRPGRPIGYVWIGFGVLLLAIGLLVLPAMFEPVGVEATTPAGFPGLDVGGSGVSLPGISVSSGGPFAALHGIFGAFQVVWLLMGLGVIAFGVYIVLNPNAAFVEVDTTADTFRVGVQATAEPASPDVSSAPALLRELVQLHDEGLVSDAEFGAKRAEILARKW